MGGGYNEGGKKPISAIMAQVYAGTHNKEEENTMNQKIIELMAKLSNTLEQRDKEIEELWGYLADVPVDMDEDGATVLGEPFGNFQVGTEIEEVWHWFDQRYSKGVAALMYQPVSGVLSHESWGVFECTSKQCVFNHEGECRFALVNTRRPKITEKNGCEEGVNID